MTDQYQTKEGVIRLFKIGDFYEAFDADAEIVARELTLVITTARGLNPRKMTGMPYYSVDRNVAILREKGHTVEVIEQC